MDRKILAAIVVIIIIIAMAIPVALLIGEEESTDAVITINEVMYDPYGDDAGNEWIELYNPGQESQSVNGWSVVNGSGTIADLPDWTVPAGAYLLIHLGEGTNDQNFSDGHGDYYTGITQPKLNNDMDEVGIFDGSSLTSKRIVDFTCWSTTEYQGGNYYHVAVDAGIWSDGDYFDVGYPSGNSMVAGYSMGLDKDSTDTNSSAGWARNGGIDAYFPTMGERNAAPYFDADGGIKLVQTKFNLFMMEWGYGVVEATHETIQESEEWDEVSVTATHSFVVEMGNATANVTGEGTYSWLRVNDTLWNDSISLATVMDEAPWMNLTYERTYLNTGLVQVVEEYQLCVESSWDPVNDTEEEPYNGTVEMELVEDYYSSSSIMTVTQMGLLHYTVNTTDLRMLEYRNETQLVEFDKEYRYHSDKVVEAWTNLSMTSDSRESMTASAHYTQTSEVGWHGVYDLGDMEVDYAEYDISYGENAYTMVDDGHFSLLEVSDGVFDVNCSIPVETDDPVPKTMNVGVTGQIQVSEVGDDLVYSGNITSNEYNYTQTFCIDGYESVVGGAACAIAGGLIGAIFVGVGAIIGGGIGAAACGAAGVAVENANEDDDEKPTIEFELGESGSNKERGWIKATITISDNEEVDTVKYHSHSANQGKTWNSKYKKDAKTKTIERTYVNTKCTPDYRTVTIKAWDTSGNRAVESKQIIVPARDCTPNVQNTTPENGSCCVPVDSQIVVEFCKPMNKTSVLGAIMLSPTVDWTATWSTDNTTITITPTENLTAMSVYDVTITTAAKSWAEYSLLENYTFWFETGEPTPPSVFIEYPPNGFTTDIPFVTAFGVMEDNVGIVEVGYLVEWGTGEENVSFIVDPMEPVHPFSFEVALHSGENTITAWAVDSSGNYAEAEVMVLYTPPMVI